VNWADAKRRVLKSYREWIRAVCSPHILWLIVVCLSVVAAEAVEDKQLEAGFGME
jgi:hypothetical protein